MAKKATKSRAAKPAKTAARKPAAAARKPAAAAKKPAARKPAVKKVVARKPAAAAAPARGKKAAAGTFKPVKQSVTIRLDSDVVAWFKKKADKYQTEINSVLRSYMVKRS